MKNKQENLDRYCQECGTKMDVKTVDTSYYSSSTGKRIKSEYHIWRCPNIPWYLPGFLAYNSSHSYDDESSINGVL